MIVRWGLGALPGVLAQLGLERPLLVTSSRWQDVDLEVRDRYSGVRRHAPLETVREATAAAKRADGLVGLGGGSAIDTAKAVSAATGLALVAVPTTYAGAEWTSYFGMRDEAGRTKSGGSGARTVGIVYEPKLTLGLSAEESGGTALNALAHSAEALYVDGHNEAADHEALAGAALIDEWLPRVLANGEEIEARTRLLEGAMHAGAALGGSGLALGHAMAQALGGRYGLPHGALNAICLPAALRFNEAAVPEALAAFGRAMGAAEPIARVEELARLSGFTRLRDLGVPAEELAEIAAAAAASPGALANPRAASPAEIADLLQSVW